MKGYTYLIASFIGLVLTEAQIFGTNEAGSECFCLPTNQICNPKKAVPENAIRMVLADMIQLRTQTKEPLCENNGIPCCFEGIRQLAPTPATVACSSPGTPECDPNNALEQNSNAVRTNEAVLECFCLPPNQICNPGEAVPDNSIKMVLEDIIQLRTKGAENLCEENRVHCCFHVPAQQPPTRNRGPIPGPGDCGFSNNIERRRNPGEANFGKYPWMSLVVDHNNAFVATGALISPSIVITVAHRLRNQNNLLIRLGDYDIANEFDRDQYPVQIIGVAEIIIHPNYNRSNNVINNLAILKLRRRAVFSPHINIACLPELHQLFNGKRCFLSGWGKKTLEGNFQTIMKEVKLPIVDLQSCQRILRTSPNISSRFLLDESFICAGGEIGMDACDGDGGAPLVCKSGGRSVVVGLVAWGQSCGTRYPGVYVNVAHFRNFIDSYL